MPAGKSYILSAVSLEPYKRTYRESSKIRLFNTI